MKPSAWLRGISRAPMFAFVVIVLVACVVAINASTFSAIHALRWKALPYADDDALLAASLPTFDACHAALKVADDA